MPFIGQQPTSGLFIELDSLTASATANYDLQLNGAYYYPESVNNLLVSINGVIQGSNTLSLSGYTLTVGATLSSSDTIDFVRVFGNVGTISTPTDGSVTANKIGTGAVTSAKIADGTIVNADINASAGIAGSKLGTGAILQVQHTQYTDTFSQSLTADVDAVLGSAVLSVNITPKSTSSIIKLDAHIFHEWSDTSAPHNSVWFFYRDSTKLAHPASGDRACGISSSAISYEGIDADSTPETVYYTYFDSPTTTSQVTYKIGVRNNRASSVNVNKTATDTDNGQFERGISFISATEIGG